MVLVDTSVWVNHLRHGNGVLATLLDETQVLVHPFVIGELACGHLSNRTRILALLHRLPPAPRATDSEVLAFIERRSLMGVGVGYVDTHLLAAAALGRVPILTSDRRLARVASGLGLAYA